MTFCPNTSSPAEGDQAPSFSNFISPLQGKQISNNYWCLDAKNQ